MVKDVGNIAAVHIGFVGLDDHELNILKPPLYEALGLICTVGVLTGLDSVFDDLRLRDSMESARKIGIIFDGVLLL